MARQILSTDPFQKAKLDNSRTVNVVALDKVRFKGEIMVPGNTYQMTRSDLVLYSKHVKIVATPSKMKATSNTNSLPVRESGEKKEVIKNKSTKKKTDKKEKK